MKFETICGLEHKVEQGVHNSKSVSDVTFYKRSGIASLLFYSEELEYNKFDNLSPILREPMLLLEKSFMEVF